MGDMPPPVMDNRIFTHALLEQGARDLTVVTNNAGSGDTDVAALLRERRVRKIVCSYPRSTGSIWFEELYRAREIGTSRYHAASGRENFSAVSVPQPSTAAQL